MESDAWRRPGCLALIVGVLVGGGILLFLLLPGGNDDTGDESLSGATPPPTTSTCSDVTAAFRAAAARIGEPAVAEQASGRVGHVCWEPTGELRVDIDYPSDIEAGSAPMLWLCNAATAFIDDSGREWHGFTAYSQAQVTLGRPVLRKIEPNGPCVNPARNA